MNYYLTTNYHPDFLMHHGIKGMKWGVRKQRSAAGTGYRALAKADATKKQTKSKKTMSTAKKVAIGVAVAAAVGATAYVSIKKGNAKQMATGQSEVTRQLAQNRAVAKEIYSRHHNGGKITRKDITNASKDMRGRYDDFSTLRWNKNTTEPQRSYYGHKLTGHSSRQIRMTAAADKYQRAKSHAGRINMSEHSSPGSKEWANRVADRRYDEMMKEYHRLDGKNSKNYKPRASRKIRKLK